MEINKNLQNKIVKLFKKKVKCPTCKKKSDNKLTPFCSKKCSDIDLMKWLSDESFNNLV